MASKLVHGFVEVGTCEVASLCNAKPLAVGPGAISSPNKSATNDAGPYMQDSGYELLRMGERRSSSGELSVWLAARTRTSILDE